VLENFEGDYNPDQWKTWGKTALERTREYAYRGKYSLKLIYNSDSGGVRYYPPVTDWSEYSRLRFTISNPHVERKYRILYIEDGSKVHRPGGSSSIPHGILEMNRESSRTFILDIQEESPIDFSQVKCLIFGKGIPETRFYIDEIELLTREDVLNETVGVYREKIDALLTRLEDYLPGANSYYKPLIDRLISSLKEAEIKDASETEQVDNLILQAERVCTVLELLESRRKKDSPWALAAARPTSKIFRDEKNDYIDGEVKLSAAGGEWESFQIVVAPAEPLQSVRLIPEDFILDASPRVRIEASNVVVNPVGYVEVTNSFYYASSREGWWPDVLIDNQPVDIRDRIQPFWVSVFVPSGQHPGHYSGKIRIISGEHQEVFNYTVQVRNFSLPVRGRCRTLFSFTYSPEDRAIRRKCYELLLSHRLNPVNIYINGAVQKGYQPEKEDLPFCLERGLNALPIWNPYNADNEESPYIYDDEYKAKIAAFIADYEPYLKKHGAWDMAMVLGFDEVMHKSKEVVEKNLLGVRDICSFIRAKFPALDIANIGGKLDISRQLMDIWITGVGDYPRLRQQNAEIMFYWVYMDPSFMLDLPGIAPRVCGWIAYKYGASGMGYYSTIRGFSGTVPRGVDWSEEAYPTSNPRNIGRNGDGRLVYHAADGSILSSIRLENIRDGIEDYEYLALLSRSDSPEARQLLSIPDEICTEIPTEYTKEIEVLEDYRQRVAELIESEGL
jgi:hypothetical protein